MSTDILVVDDEAAIADLVEICLKNEGYTVHKFYTGKEALSCVESTHLDLAILDVMLPDVDGFTLCQKIREDHLFPILMLTAKVEDMDKIMGLTLGADDYLTKPFNPLELVARVKAQLRRYKQYNTGAESGDGALVISGLVLDRRAHTCTLNDRPLSLTPTEFSILQILCEHKGEVVSSEELFHQIWKDEYYTKNNSTITSHIRNLREKMGDSYEDPKYIKTVWGYGYKIEG